VALETHHEEHPGTHRCRHVAIVYHKNNPVVVGFNRAKTHPLQLKYSQNQNKLHLHAEIDAIARATRLDTVFEKCDLFVGRLAKGAIRESCPCPSCWSAIEAFGFRSVTWTTDEGTCLTHTF
jgi:tRNA(Arg) A34 adenosine deaminase TadA